jgi:hypothetical protein
MIEQGASPRLLIPSSYSGVKFFILNKAMQPVITVEDIGKNPTDCGRCHKCLKGITSGGMSITSMYMIICPICGNKRCPKATDHDLLCTNSNDAGQKGSIYA